MFNLFRTLARGAAAQAREDLIDRNALLILDQQIRETRAALERSRMALATAEAGDKAEGRRLAEVEARAADLEERAVAALAANRDTLASEAAEAIAELERGRRIAAAAESARRLGVAATPEDRATLTEAEATLARLRDRQAQAADTEAALADIEPGADIAARLEREGFGRATRPTAAAVLERLRGRAAAL